LNCLRALQGFDVFLSAREEERNRDIGDLRIIVSCFFLYLFLMTAVSGHALDPSKRITQYQHKVWRSGHWGLKSMRERAGRLGAELEVWSEPGAGTEIELRVPASIAYETVRSQDSSLKFWRRKRNP
jgi:hypothetical protein